MMKPFGLVGVGLCFFLFTARDGMAQKKFVPNYDEDKVPAYTLPNPLVMMDGSKVTDAATWTKMRRPEVLALFEKHMFGKTPVGKPKEMTFEVTSIDKQALGGKAVRKEVTIYFTGKKAGPKMNLLIYLPADAKKPVPLFLMPNFEGNHTVNADPGITLARHWSKVGDKMIAKVADVKTRGKNARRWAIDEILKEGYGVATFYYGDLYPDAKEGYTESIQPHFLRDGQTAPAPDEWGAIGVWAWGLSRALDYLESDADVDAGRVIVLGHSRLGKTALWAGVQDQRFAIVISNDSGCGGAALSRRRFGETVWRINTAFPHWFCGNFHKYNDKEDDLPLDQHLLVALAAPRPVYVASAVEDRWADPRGEFLSALHADPVYRLLGTNGLPTKEMPKANQPVMGQIGYHLRTGAHDVTLYDWEQYLKFANIHLKKR